MAVERAITTLEDGTVYAERISVFYEDESGTHLTFLMHPDSLYFPVHKAMSKVISGGVTQSSDPEQKARNNLAKLIKVAIKGLFLMYGEQILDLLFKSKEHPRPQKGDDLLEWYTDVFTRLSISDLMKNDTLLYGKAHVQENCYEVLRVDTRPVTIAPSSGDDV